MLSDITIENLGPAAKTRPQDQPAPVSGPYRVLPLTWAGMPVGDTAALEAFLADHEHVGELIQLCPAWVGIPMAIPGALARPGQKVPMGLQMQMVGGVAVYRVRVRDGGV